MDGVYFVIGCALLLGIFAGSAIVLGALLTLHAIGGVS